MNPYDDDEYIHILLDISFTYVLAPYNILCMCLGHRCNCKANYNRQWQKLASKSTSSKYNEFIVQSRSTDRYIKLYPRYHCLSSWCRYPYKSVQTRPSCERYTFARYSKLRHFICRICLNMNYASLFSLFVSISCNIFSVSVFVKYM